MLRAIFLLICFSLFATSSFGLGQKLLSRYTLPLGMEADSYDLALKAAEKMCDECKGVNPFNFPIIVSLGTSKSRGVITIHYKFDPEAGSVCTSPPVGLVPSTKRIFVPRFGAEFYMHIRTVKGEDGSPCLDINVTQSKGIGREIFDKEMEILVETYKRYLERLLTGN